MTQQATLKALEIQACKNRRRAVSMVQNARSGHLGGSLSALDILTVLYFRVLRVYPANPADPTRDRFVLSKGHATPALYSTLAARGFLEDSELDGFRQLAGHLSGHTEMTKVAGVDMSAGSLGQGLSAAVGMALAARLDGLDYRTFALLGDGEIQEGQVWEAAMAAGHFGLDKLVAIVDNNGLQIDGSIEEVMSPYPIGAKFAAFGWDVREIDGHNYAEIEAAVTNTIAGKPTAVIATTIKGQGVSFMEGDVAWHGALPSPEQFEVALDELERHLRELEAQR